MQMRSINISAAATAVSSAHLASLRVALHVTKRHNGATASDRTRVMVGNGTCSASHEAVRDSGSAGLLFALVPGDQHQRVPTYHADN